MNLRTLTNLKPTKSRALMRIDADVQIARGVIPPESRFRLDAVLPTLQFLLKRGHKLTIMAHRGRPVGKKVLSLSLAPAQKYIESRLHLDREMRARMHWLSNTRFDPREEKNDPHFARELAIGQDVFIFDAFATAHRTHASTVGVAKILPTYAGFQFEKEIRELSAVRDHAQKPIALIIGGLKIETKAPLIKNFSKSASVIYMGGVMASVFLKAAGCDVGNYVAEPTSIAIARSLIKNERIRIPEDVIVSRGGKMWRAVNVPHELLKKCVLANGREKILDIGPASIVLMSETLRSARTIIWNGPVGEFERPPFDLGTKRIAKLLSFLGQRGAHVIAGGGETVSAILAARASRGYSHISTGGGAMLAFLSGEKLPILDVLSQH